MFTNSTTSKFFFICAATLLCGTIVFAQPEPGSFSVTPKIGLQVSKLMGDSEMGSLFSIVDRTRLYELYNQGNNQWGNNIPEEEYANRILLMFDKPHSHTGFAGGVDFQYQISKRWAVLAGFNYSYKKSRYETDHCTTSYMQEPNFDWESKELNLQLHYLQVPVMTRYYVYKGLALNAGIQLGGLRQAYLNYKHRIKFNNASQYIIQDEIFGRYKSKQFEAGKWYEIKEKIETTDTFERFDFSIPVGVSFDYRHLLFEARAEFGLSDMSKNNDADCRVQAFTFSVGYRFDL